MAFNQLLMTDSQQKEFSKLCSAVRSAEEYLKYQKEIYAAKPLTYVQKRVESKLQTAQGRLDKLEKELEKGLEKLKEQYEKDVQKLKDTFKQEEKDLEEKISSLEKELLSQTEPVGVIDARIRLKNATEKRDSWIQAIDPSISSYTAPKPLPTYSTPVRSLISNQMEAEFARETEESQRRLKEKQRADREREFQEAEEREKARKLLEANRRLVEEQERKRQDEIRQRELNGEVISLAPPVVSSNSSLTDPKDDDWNSDDEREATRRAEEVKAARLAKLATPPPPSRPKKQIKRVQIKEVAPGISLYPTPLSED